MKKLILMLLLVTTVVMAGWDKEEFDESEFHSGVKVGLTYSNITGDDTKDGDNNFKFGFELGAFMLYRINDLITFQPEILFTQKGVEIDGSGANTNLTYNYVQVPLLLAFKTAPGLKIYGGAYVSMLTNIWVSNSDATSEQESDFEDQLEKDASTYDMGISVGVMFRGNNNMLFDFRYERGFNTITENTKEGGGDYEVYNQTFKISFGWLF